MTQAETLVRQTLAPNGGAVQLVDGLCAYFGSDLRFEIQSPHHPWSSTSYPETSPPFCQIVVTVHLFQPAIVHELLHVKLDQENFPTPVPHIGLEYGEAVYIADTLSHILFLDEYCRLGLDKIDFFFQRGKLEDLAEVERSFDVFQNTNGYGRFARGVWNRLYLAHLSAQHMGFPNLADDYMRIGQRRFSTMASDAKWIEKWLARKGFSLADQFAPTITEFMTEFGLPTPRFARVEPVGGQIQFVPLP
jgi:hypothetical protein